MGKFSVGEEFTTKNYGNVRIKESDGKARVIVVFENTGYEKSVSKCELAKGNIRDNFAETVCGFGISDIPSRVNGEKTYTYIRWLAMIKRCYGNNVGRVVENYKDCQVSQQFKRLSDFSTWAESQVGFGNDGWGLDKDILVKGNKIYSPDTCCFVPPEINSIFTFGNRANNEKLLGVKKCSENVLIAQTSLNGKYKHLGSFKNENEAFNCYKMFKEDRIKYLAFKWRDDIDKKVYDALMSWEV